MQIPRFLLPIASLALAIADVFHKDSDGGAKVTRAELRELGDRLRGVVDAELAGPVQVGDEILVYVGDNTDGSQQWRPGIVVRTWGGTTVNAQVFVDGFNDKGHLERLGINPQPMCIWWATSIIAGDSVGQWRRA